MPVSWPEVVGIIGVSMASRIQEEGMVVVLDVESESIEYLTKFVEVAMPVLEAIAERHIRQDEVPGLAGGAISHLKSQGIPTLLDDLRLRVSYLEDRQREARHVIRDLMSITTTPGGTLSVHARASNFLKETV